MCTAGGGFAVAAASVLIRARDGPHFDRATTPTQPARNSHRAGKRWSVLPTDESMLSHSEVQGDIADRISLREPCTSSVSPERGNGW